MHRSFLRAVPVLLTLLCGVTTAQDTAPTAATDDFVRWSDFVPSGVKLSVYGWLRTDMQYADSRFNDVQLPVFVQSEDPAAPANVGAKKNDSDFALQAHNTRFGINFQGPDVEALGSPELRGNVEIDFNNNGVGDSDSRNAIRMRKAYVELVWTKWSLLVGQDWDVISPLLPAVNADISMWGAGNTGDRRPQVRAEYRTPWAGGEFTTALSVALGGAVSGPIVEGGLRSGENSGRPMISARVGYHGKTTSGGDYQFGVWGHSSQDDYDALGIGSDQTYNSSSIGLDLRVPIRGDQSWLLGELWEGKNLDDIRGGILQGVNSTTGEEIEAEGGFVELGFKATEHMTLHGGFSLDNPNNSDLSVNQRSRNEAAYLAARWHFGALGFGLEYLNWQTDYIGLADGTANRVQGFLAFYF